MNMSRIPEALSNVMMWLSALKVRGRIFFHWTTKGKDLEFTLRIPANEAIAVPAKELANLNKARSVSEKLRILRRIALLVENRRK